MANFNAKIGHDFSNNPTYEWEFGVMCKTFFPIPNFYLWWKINLIVKHLIFLPPVAESEEVVDKTASSDSTAPQEATTTTPAPESDAPFLSSKFDSFSFSQIASGPGFQELAKSSPSGKNVFAGAGTPLFQNLNTSAGDDGGGKLLGL